MLDKGGWIWYSNQARLRAEASGGVQRTLKTIQRKNAQLKEEHAGDRVEISEDSKEFYIERCEGLNGRV